MPLTFSEISWPCKVWSVWCTFYGNGIFKMKPTHWPMLFSKYSWPHWFKAHPPPMVNARLSTLGWISKVNSSVFVHLLRIRFQLWLYRIYASLKVFFRFYFFRQKPYCFKNAIKKMCYALSPNNMTALSTKWVALQRNTSENKQKT